MVKLHMDSTKHETRGNFSLLPDGWYAAEIEESELRPAKSGGNYLSLRFVISEGNYKNRKLFENLNIEHDNEVVVEIAMGTLATIIQSCGLTKIEDTDQLHGKPMMIKVGTEPAKDGYDARNNIKGYKEYQEEAKNKKKKTEKLVFEDDEDSWSDFLFFSFFFVF